MLCYACLFNVMMTFIAHVPFPYYYSLINFIWLVIPLKDIICQMKPIGNKEEIIPDFSLKITRFDFTKNGGVDEA